MTPERLAKIRAFDVGDPATWVAQDEGALVRELLAHIDTLTAERDALKVERDQWERNHEALQEKFDCDKSCGCAYDHADDLCGYHSPQVIAAEARALAARAEALEEAASWIEDERNEPHWGQDNNLRTALTTVKECAVMIRALAQPKETTK